MEKEILKIYEKVAELLPLEYERYGEVCFCKTLALAMLSIRVGYNVINFREAGIETADYHRVYDMMKCEFSPEGQLSLLYSYEPKETRTRGAAYWFDPEDYESRKKIIEDLLEKVKSQN